MAIQSEFVNYLLELLHPFGGVTARRMFGGYGIYKEAQIFGVVIDDTLYLKADDIHRAAFVSRGLEPFVYESKSRGKQVSIGYYQCPEDALESAALMLDWARASYAAALRVATKKALAVRKPKSVSHAKVTGNVTKKPTPVTTRVKAVAKRKAPKKP